MTEDQTLIDDMDIAQSLYSDAYKEAFGFRPRSFSRFATVQDVYEAIQDLQPIIDEEIAHTKMMQDNRWDDWNEHIHTICTDHTIDIATAVRWDMEAEGIDNPADLDFYCYLHGLSYAKTPYIKEMING